MALYHFHVEQIKRSEGRTAVASAAYRAGEKLHNLWDGETHDYTRKGGVVLKEIFLPEHAPERFSDRYTLWNEVEQVEKRADAQLAYSFDIALQNEFSMDENVALAREFVQKYFVSDGMIVDLAIHQPDREEGGIQNPHFHVLVPIRPLNKDGTWGAKQHRVYHLDENGERIPLTICDYDREKETVTIVVQTIGAGTERMMALNEGDSLEDFVGPLGCPSELCQEDNLEETKKKHIVFIAGGLGTAPVYPQVKWLKEHGVDADVIMGFRNKDILFFEDEMKAVAKNLYVCTDDGSYGFHGNGSQQLQALVDAGNTYDCCVAIGPMIMMKFTCLLTKKLEIPTIVSMNPIMVDGTGMCGACRLIVDGKVKFACVDGPEFDGHLVDFDQAMKRQQQYKTEEGRAKLAYEEGATHHGGCGNCGGDK